MFTGADPGHECRLPNTSTVNETVYRDGQCGVVVERGGENVSEACPDGYSYGSMFESTILTEVSES